MSKSAPRAWSDFKWNSFKWLLDSWRLVRRSESPLQMSHLQKAQKYISRTEDGGPPRRSPWTRITFHKLRRWFFWPTAFKTRKKEGRRYGVLFTCVESRTIPLEVSNRHGTDSFINALRRFIFQTAPIRLLRSDEGTNFVGAKTELNEALNR